jgi:hypothetical protein
MQHKNQPFRVAYLVAIIIILSLVSSLIVHPKAASVPIVSIAKDYDNKVGDTYQENCVLFTRSLVKSLPYGLLSFENKKAIINSSKAVVGAVAIVKTGNSYGHVSYVEKVNGSTITTLDANWTYQGKVHIVRRTGSASVLGIVGYYVPENLTSHSTTSTTKKVTKSTTKKTTTTSTTKKTTTSETKVAVAAPKKLTASISLTTSKNYRTSSGVAVFSTVTKSKTDKVTSAGLYLWKKGTKKPSKPLTKETFSKGFTSQTSVTIYYRPGIAFGSKLKSKTTYNYQIYAVVNGKTLTTSIGSITTK